MTHDIGKLAGPVEAGLQGQELRARTACVPFRTFVWDTGNFRG